MSSNTNNKKTEEEKDIQEKKMLSTLFATFYSPITFFFLMFLIAIIFIWVASSGSDRTQYLSIILLVFIVIGNTFLFFRNGKGESKNNLKKSKTKSKVEAKDETYVDDLLSQLGKEYLIIKRDLDRIVIAPAGLFLIEIKNTSGRYSALNNDLLQDGKVMEENYLQESSDQVKFWREKLKNHFQGKPFINVFGRLFLLNTRWVDEKAMSLAKRYNTRICINDYILKNLKDYGSKKRLNPEDQKKIYDFIESKK